MIDARNEIMQSYPLQQPYMDDETEAHIMDKLMDLPAEEVPRALAKFEAQVDLKLPFTPGQHIECASPDTAIRTWGRKCIQAYERNFGNSEGFLIAELETTAVMLDKEAVIYD